MSQPEKHVLSEIKQSLGLLVNKDRGRLKAKINYQETNLLFYFFVLPNLFNSKSISTHLNEFEQSRNHCSCGEVKFVHFQITLSLASSPKFIKFAYIRKNSPRICRRMPWIISEILALQVPISIDSHHLLFVAATLSV